MGNTFIVNLEQSYTQLLQALRIGLGMTDLPPKEIEPLFQEMILVTIQLGDVTESRASTIARAYSVFQCYGLDTGLTLGRAADLVDIFQTAVLNELAAILGEHLTQCKTVRPWYNSVIVISD